MHATKALLFTILLVIFLIGFGLGLAAIHAFGFFIVATVVAVIGGRWIGRRWHMKD